VRFSVQAAGAVPPARADAAAVAQILLNLVLNAADAARAAEAPEVWLRVGVAPPRALRAGEQDPEVAAARRPEAVEVRVMDNGPGVAPEDRERIFLPFVTTKAPGEGTGLGLANALRLAEEQGGTVEMVDAEAPARTAFALRLPVATPPGRGVRGERP
jgi:two-component system NtrC family sensor kinase